MINLTKMLRILFIIIGFVSINVNAQNVVLAKVVDGKAYIGHTVAAGETLYGIARIYGITPKDLASFNGLNAQKGLEKNSVLKIPITPATISAKACSNCATIKYAVQPHEGLYRIGVNFGNIGTQNLTKLNNLTSNNLATGQELIVGYMKATGNEISMADNSIAIETNPTKETKLEDATKEKVAAKPALVVKEDTKKEKSVAKQVPLVNDSYVKETTLPRKQEVATTQPVNHPIEKAEDLMATTKAENLPIGSADGAFRPQFTNKFAQTKSGTAGIFKSISGWQDKKYYALINSVESGTILRIGTATGKAIYAKVLGPIPYVKGSDALLLRISDAGAVALGVAEETMQVTVNY